MNRFKESLWPAAKIESALWNIHGDREKHPDGFNAADFMPGAKVQTQEDKLREFAERVMAGDTFQDEDDQPDEAEQLRFRNTMQSLI